MKNFFVLLVTVVGIILIPGNAEAQTVQKTASAQLVSEVNLKMQSDARVLALENIFKKNYSPLLDSATSYIELADKNGIDWKLLPAISGLESSFGKRLMPNSYNAYGWGGGHIYFKSWDDGIDTITKSLKEKYYKRGADDVWKIGPIYAESPTWSVRVNGFMESIEKEYISLIRSNVDMSI